MSNKEISDQKVERRLQEERSCGTRGRERRIFVIAPIELLKICVVVLNSFIEHNKRFLTAIRLRYQVKLTS